MLYFDFIKFISAFAYLVIYYNLGGEKQMKNIEDLNYKIIKAILSYIVLKLIDEGIATHGYGLMRQIKRHYGVSFNSSTLYPVLAKLEHAQLISGSWQMQMSKPQKTYILTHSGKIYLREQEITLQYLNHILTQKNPLEVETWLLQKRG